MVPGSNPGVASFGVKHSHMRVWYSDVFVHRPKDLGAKQLGERGHHMKFLGYPHNSSGYRTYAPVTHKVKVVWAPIFREEACPHASIFFESEAVDSNDDLLLDPANAPPQERNTLDSSEAPSPDPPASPPASPTPPPPHPPPTQATPFPPFP